MNHRSYIYVAQRKPLSVVLLFLAPMLGWFAVGGCVERSPQPKGILEPRVTFYFEDLPVPNGFNWDRRHSEHKSDAGYRSVNHLYVGQANPLAVKNFYIQYMPRSGWELVNQSLQASQDVLNYRKGQEHCKIMIEPSGSLFGKEKSQVRAIVRYAKSSDLPEKPAN